MALPSTGQIALSQENTELEKTSSTSINMNSTEVRNLFQRTTAGTSVALSDGRGKSFTQAFSLSTRPTNGALRDWLVTGGWDQWRIPVVTISGSISAPTTGGNGLEVAGSFPNGIRIIINSGAGIYGCGGIGGPGRTPGGGGGSGSFGGTGLYCSLGSSANTFVAITNNGTIAGGGGGGGGGASGQGTFLVGSGEGGDVYETYTFGGGGGGGGRTGPGTNISGGAGGGSATFVGSAGGTSASTGAGGGGAGGVYLSIYKGGDGGSGGSWGVAGSNGATVSNITLLYGAGSGGSAGSAITKVTATMRYNTLGSIFGSYPAS